MVGSYDAVRTTGRYDALTDRADGLSKAERELVVGATSGANRFAPTQDAQRFGGLNSGVTGDVRFC